MDNLVQAGAHDIAGRTFVLGNTIKRLVLDMQERKQTCKVAELCFFVRDTNSLYFRCHLLHRHVDRKSFVPHDVIARYLDHYRET